MSEPRKLRCYQYVNRPYEQVRALLRHEPLELLQRATTSAAARAGTLAANLHVTVGGIEVGVDVKPYLQNPRGRNRRRSLPGHVPGDRLGGQPRARAIPFDAALELSAWPLSSTETQLEVTGEYRPPLGAVGNVVDAAVGHRIAEASVHRFLDDVVEQMKRDLPT